MTKRAEKPMYMYSQHKLFVAHSMGGVDTALQHTLPFHYVLISHIA